MKVKTTELTGDALNWAVAQAEGLSCDVFEGQVVVGLDCADGEGGLHYDYVYKPDTDWSEAGPIVEREGLNLVAPNIYRLGEEKHVFPVITWRALKRKDEADFAIRGEGPTPLIAAMRCFVLSKLGDIIDIPKALL